MTFEEQIQRVVELLGSALPGASAADLANVEERLGIRLPQDVRALLGAFNGSEEYTDTDHGWLRIWSASEWRPPPTEYVAPPTRRMVLFADHSINAWWYAFDFSAQPLSSAVYLVGVAEPWLVARSLTGFLQAIIDGDMALYGGIDPS